MNAENPTLSMDTSAALPEVPDLNPARLWRGWTFWFGPLISIAILGATLLALRHFDLVPDLSAPCLFCIIRFSIPPPDLSA